MSERPKWPWITLIALQAVQALSLIPWLPMAGLSVMAFDAPGSTERWEPWAFVLTIWSYPIWLLAAAVAAWILYALRWTKTALGVAIVFTLPMPALLGIIVLGNLFG